MHQIILIGAGDYYKNFFAPSLGLLEEEKRAAFRLIVGREPQYPQTPKGVSYLSRGKNEKLSFLLSDFAGPETVVVLSHANKFHTPDAEDLVKNDFKIMIEKPYCIDVQQLKTLESLMRAKPQNIVLLEYYLTMKSIPLLILAGKVKKESFYFQKKGLLEFEARAFQEKMEELLGEPESVFVDILEGEGETGRVDHRGPHLSDLREGGGMIQDLGIHAFSPLFGLEDYLGQIDRSFAGGRVKLGKNKEYLAMVKKKFRIPEQYIGESYAEIEFSTKKGVSVKTRVGKYWPDNKNQRGLKIKGSRGEIFLDLSSCDLYFEGRKVLGIPKLPGSKYYSLIRAGLEILSGNNPFNFDASSAAFSAQSFVLNILAKAHPIMYSK